MAKCGSINSATVGSVWALVPSWAQSLSWRLPTSSGKTGVRLCYVNIISIIPRTVTDVVPSPTSSSCTLDISTRIFAAGLSMPIDFRMVAPSFVTSTWKFVEIRALVNKMMHPHYQNYKDYRWLTWPAFLPMETRILSIPLGPSVLLTRSPTAMAPIKLDMRATSAFSSSASFFKILIGFSDTWNIRSCDLVGLNTRADSQHPKK